MGCVIAGGGPAGAMLALLLARSGAEVTLLEKHGDFLRDFRGDTIHPSTMEVLDELGLAEELLKLPHRKAYSLTVVSDAGDIRLVNVRNLRTRYNYITFVPQWDFLTLVTRAAARYPNFRLLMNAEAVDLIREGGAVRGVRYRDPSGEHEIRADLTVAADGRTSALRAKADLTPQDLGAPMDVLWFRLPRDPGDREDPFLRVSRGRLMVAINRGDYWQLAYVILKGGHERLTHEGIGALRRPIAELLPWLAGRAEQINSYDDVSVLTVRLDRLRRWHRPGLLCIGDAAHAMSPVFGVGINMAVQDAVATANLLAGPLRHGGPIPERALHLVQRRRMPPTRITQALQQVIQNRFISPTLSGDADPARRLPRDLTAIPVLNALVARVIGLGVRPEHLMAKQV
ncbi:FAD-dependent oxidoreductase [Nonomuraea sp. NPDC004580]|uniref:FAD-dependent oxidoreductase n=1 Tax=Nonomuraea sp. NPDC004580 TaxID=3154552 RepID=UPI0033AE16E4